MSDSPRVTELLRGRAGIPAMGVTTVGPPAGHLGCVCRGRKPAAKGLVGPSKAPVALVLGEKGIVASPGAGALFQTAAQVCLGAKVGRGLSSRQVPELGRNGMYSGTEPLWGRTPGAPSAFASC